MTTERALRSRAARPGAAGRLRPPGRRHRREARAQARSRSISSLRDEDGQDGHAADRSSTSPRILTLNYFRCAGICTPQLNGVADVLNETDARSRQGLPGPDGQLRRRATRRRSRPQKRDELPRRDQAALPARRPGASSPGTRPTTQGPGRRGRLQVQAAGRGLRPRRPRSSSSRPKGTVTRYMYGVHVPAGRRPDGGPGGGAQARRARRSPSS